MPSNHLRQLLVQRQLLSPAQLQQIQQQQQHDHRRFWELACETLGTIPAQIWQTCAVELRHSCARVNLIYERHDPATQEHIHARDAWEYLILPLREEAGELVCATAEGTLADAIAYMEQHDISDYRFVIAPVSQLEQFIAELYDYEGVDTD